MLSAPADAIEEQFYSVDEHVTPNGARIYFEGQQPIEEPGLSCFLRDGDRVFHTYSFYGRGAEMNGGSYYFLDLTALGRQEEWEEPKDRTDDTRAPSPDFAR